MTIRWLVTNHAVDRYIGRVDRTALAGPTMTAMRAVIHKATRLQQNTRQGSERWLLALDGADSPPFVIVAKRDPQMRCHVAVTVLPMSELNEQSDDTMDEVLAAYRRANGDRSPEDDMNRAPVRKLSPRPSSDLAQQVNDLRGKVLSLEIELDKAKEKNDACSHLTRAITVLDRDVGRIAEERDKQEFKAAHLEGLLRVAMDGLHRLAESSPSAAQTIRRVALMDERRASKAFASVKDHEEPRVPADA